MFPHFNRSNCYRTLVRHQLNKLPKEGEETKGTFRKYNPGYLHLDTFYLPKLEEHRKYCFVAIDRTTKLIFLWVYPSKTKESACDFLNRCLSFFPFRIRRILTDNGKEYTLKGFKNRWGEKLTKIHPFGQICQENRIKHLTTKTKCPKTNGMAENMIKLVKEATIKRFNYKNVFEMEMSLFQFIITWNFFRKNKTLKTKTPYQSTIEWYLQKPKLFLKDPTLVVSTMR